MMQTEDRKTNGSKNVVPASRNQTDSGHIVKHKRKSDDSAQLDLKVRCPCGYSMANDSMIKVHNAIHSNMLVALSYPRSPQTFLQNYHPSFIVICAESVKQTRYVQKRRLNPYAQMMQAYTETFLSQALQIAVDGINALHRLCFRNPTNFLSNRHSNKSLPIWSLVFVYLLASQSFTYMLQSDHLLVALYAHDCCSALQTSLPKEMNHDNTNCKSVFGIWMFR